MAINQISLIKHRRGRKNSGTGFPQLASGELGWAIDAQELYIGNGAVSEGAPKVGNTRILTERDILGSTEPGESCCGDILEVMVPTSNTAITFAQLPVIGVKAYQLHYVYQSTGANLYRNGILNIILNYTNNTISVSDEYDFAGDETKAENLVFSVATGFELNNIVIKYKNTTSSDTTGKVSYWFTAVAETVV